MISAELQQSKSKLGLMTKLSFLLPILSILYILTAFYSKANVNFIDSNLTPTETTPPFHNFNFGSKLEQP